MTRRLRATRIVVGDPLGNRVRVGGEKLRFIRQAMELFQLLPSLLPIGQPLRLAIAGDRRAGENRYADGRQDAEKAASMAPQPAGAAHC